MLKFNDGMQFNLEGELRPIKKSDGWYVVGKGMLMPVDNYQEAVDFIQEENNRNAKE